MTELRTLCGELGLEDVATYIQSGNVVFTAGGKPAEIEAALERAIGARFGLDVPVVVRSAAQWAAYPPANPFPKEPPNRVMLLLSKAPPAKGAEDLIETCATGGERVRRAGDALWFHYPEGAGTSKLTPALINRAIGSPGTARNYNTVMKLKEMLEA